MYNYFGFNIANPFSKAKSNSPIYHIFGKITKNKSWEFEINKDDKIITINISLSFRTDHAGLNLAFGIFGYCLHFEICDNRHWDYDNNRWQIYED